MVGIIAVIASMALGMGASTGMQLPPVTRFMAYASNSAIPNRIHEPADAVELRRRGIIKESDYLGIFQNHGFNNEQAKMYWKGSVKMLDAADLLVLKWRKHIEAAEYYKLMAKLGFEKKTADQWEIRNRFYPSPGDLITWQAKEVYELDAIEKYGLADELELLRKDEFYKAGLDDEQIRNYWIAHWEHPSWLRIREMLHRTNLTEKDVYEWFRLVEIPPFWRKKFTAIMYSPYTRVDVRRMHALGVLNREQMKTAYKELGYDEEKAENLTRFSVAYNLPAERDLTKAMIEKAYSQGEISRDEAKAFLVNMGYDVEEAELILTLKDNAMDEDVLDDRVDTIKLQFTHGVIDEAEAISRLDALDLSATYRDKIVAGIVREKEKALLMPSKADLLAWFTESYIDLPGYVDYMERRGYAHKEVKYYAKMAIEDLERGDFKTKAQEDFKELFPE